MILYTTKNHMGITLLTYKEKMISTDFSECFSYYDECKIVRIMRGDGIWNINGERYSFKKNDIFIFSRCDIRRLEQINSPLKIEQINFTPLTVYPHTHCSDIFFIRKPGFTNKISIKDNSVQLARDFDLLRQYTIDLAMTYRRELILNLVQKMVITAAQCYPVSPSNSEKYEAATLKAMEYISENLNEDLTLHTTAKKFGFSPEHFSKIFLQSVGIPFNEYVSRCRVNAVIRHLSETDSNVLETAFKYGFKSSSGFYKTFLRITGCKPKSFCQRNI